MSSEFRPSVKKIEEIVQMQNVDMKFDVRKDDCLVRVCIEPPKKDDFTAILTEAFAESFASKMESLNNTFSVSFGQPVFYASAKKVDNAKFVAIAFEKNISKQRFCISNGTLKLLLVQVITFI